jgi:uncharacterized protein YaaR (DUF327 family)
MIYDIMTWIQQCIMHHTNANDMNMVQRTQILQLVNEIEEKIEKIEKILLTNKSYRS